VHSGEWFLSDLGVHESYERWRASRKGDFLDEVRERVARILATHQPLPLDEEVAKELDRICGCAKRES
jgi:trimethylamine:corrinoid methyltransferase-like protein